MPLTLSENKSHFCGTAQERELRCQAGRKESYRMRQLDSVEYEDTLVLQQSIWAFSGEPSPSMQTTAGKCLARHIPQRELALDTPCPCQPSYADPVTEDFHVQCSRCPECRCTTDPCKLPPRGGFDCLLYCAMMPPRTTVKTEPIGARSGRCTQCKISQGHSKPLKNSTTVLFFLSTVH
jgi:hypothetical protein